MLDWKAKMAKVKTPDAIPIGSAIGAANLSQQNKLEADKISFSLNTEEVLRGLAGIG
jgi:hypothetical protein